MLTLCDDILLQIGDQLTDREKIRLSIISKNHQSLQHKFIYREKIKVRTIMYLSYFNNFERVELLDTYLLCPKFARYKYFFACTTNIPVQLIDMNITHLTFADEFNRTIKDKIPLSVTYLTFGHKFNQPIENNIPSSVTHLIFGRDFCNSIDTIPSSVTHLTFGDNFNRIIKNRLPKSVTHLTFGRSFNKKIKDSIPSSVTHLIFGTCFNHPTKGNIPPSVTHVTFGRDFYWSINYLPLSVVEVTIRYSYDRFINNDTLSRIKINRC